MELRVVPKNQPLVVYQDNLSTIILGTNGGNFKRTKHLIIRESFVREKIQNGQIELRHCPTELMIADFLTKPLTRAKLGTLLEKINLG